MHFVCIFSRLSRAEAATKDQEHADLQEGEYGLELQPGASFGSHALDASAALPSRALWSTAPLVSHSWLLNLVGLCSLSSTPRRATASVYVSLSLTQSFSSAASRVPTDMSRSSPLPLFLYGSQLEPLPRWCDVVCLLSFSSHSASQVRQIRFFKSACKSGSKFHFTVGHTTVMVTATFFGPPRPEGYSATRAEAGVAVSEAEKASAHDKAVELARTPLHTTFDATAEYGHQNELDSDDADQWAVIQFECPVPCALPAIGIGSHLDGATTSTACRLAFYGRMLRAITNEELRSLSIFKRKSKEGQIDRVQDAHTLICKGLFKPGAHPRC